MNHSKTTRTLALLAGLSSLCLFGLVACGGGGGGDAGGATASASPSVAKGKEKFDRVCATCHGKDAKGLPRLGKGLLDNQFVKSKTDGEMVEFLKTGRPASHELNTTGVDMPPKGGDPSMTEEDLKAVVAYVRTLQ